MTKMHVEWTSLAKRLNPKTEDSAQDAMALELLQRHAVGFPSLMVQKWEEAALKGDAKAQNNLALALLNGWGTKKNEVRAAKWFECAANGGHTLAMTRLGTAYFSGWGGILDPKMAVRWWERAAALGERNAVYYLGWAKYNGIGTEEDKETAFKLLKKAADLGCKKAAARLACVNLRQQQE